MEDRAAANRVTARLIPLFNLALLAYATYTIVYQLCLAYLLHPDAKRYQIDARPSVAIGILTSFCLVLALLLATYLRLLYLIVFEPGYITRSKLFFETQPRNDPAHDELHHHRGPREKHWDLEQGRSRPKKWAPPGYEGLPEIMDYITRDVYVCDGEGRPPWCSTCQSFKPARTHHCRQAERCVARMDHWCPWAGGAISSTNYKFFIQFAFWVTVLCTFTLIVLAYFLAEQQKRGIDLNVHLVVTIAIAGFFGLFTSSIFFYHLWYIAINITTIEELTWKTKVWTLAVHLKQPPPPDSNPGYKTKTFPLGPDTHNEQQGSSNGTDEKNERTFAILHSRQGENPFDLGVLGNIQNIMGNTIWDWFLPLGNSPLYHEPPAFGFLVTEMKIRAKAC